MSEDDWVYFEVVVIPDGVLVEETLVEDGWDQSSVPPSDDLVAAALEVCDG